MNKTHTASSLLLILLALSACNTDEKPNVSAKSEAATKDPSSVEAKLASAIDSARSQATADDGGSDEDSDEKSQTGPKTLTTIGDMANAWSALYDTNEPAINDYDGMPILSLVTPQGTFILSAQFDLLNSNNADGRFEGKLMLAGFQGFTEKKGSMIKFGYDDSLKQAFGRAEHVGDRVAGSGFIDLSKEIYRAEEFKERNGNKYWFDVTEFRRLDDGTMICLQLTGGSFDGRGDPKPHGSAIFLHNGPGKYDFVVATSKAGPDFTPFGFEDKGEMDKQKAIEVFTAAGYTIEKTGGIRGGKFLVDAR